MASHLIRTAIDGYYLANFSLVASYSLVREMLKDRGAADSKLASDDQLAAWEKQAALMLAGVLAIKVRLRRSFGGRSTYLLLLLVWTLVATLRGGASTRPVELAPASSLFCRAPPGKEANQRTAGAVCCSQAELHLRALVLPCRCSGSNL